MAVWLTDSLKKWKDENSKIDPKSKQRITITMTVKESILCNSLRTMLGLKSKSEFIRWAIYIAERKLEKDTSEQKTDVAVELRKKNNELSENNSTLQKELDQTKLTLSESRQASNESSQKISELETNCRVFQDNINDLESEVETLENSVKNLKAERNEVMESLKSSENKYNRMEQTISNLESERDNTATERDNANKILRSVKSENAQLRATNTALRIDANAGPISRIFRGFRKK